jgi:hypothetical protein
MKNAINLSRRIAALCQDWGKCVVSLLVGLSFIGGERQAIAEELATTNVLAAAKLQGIVNLSGHAQAFFEISSPQGPPSGHILGAGEREGDVEVLQINEEAGTVKIRKAEGTAELTFDNEAGTLVSTAPDATVGGQTKPPMRFRLQKASLSQIFILYQTITGRSLLRPATFPKYDLTLRSNGTVTTDDFIAAVERVLGEKEIHFQPDGEKFVIVGRDGDLARITPQLREMAEQIGATRGTNSSGRRPSARALSAGTGLEEGLLPAGFIDFRGVDLNQVLVIFQDFANRTLLRDSALASQQFVFRSYTPLKSSEAIYAFLAMLALNGIEIAPAGEKFLLVFATSAKSRIPSVLAKKGLGLIAQGKKPIPPGYIDFRGVYLAHVITIYKDFCGCDIELDSSLHDLPIVLRNQTALTTTEVVQGLDLLLALQGIEAVRQPDGASLKFVRSKP